MLRGLRRLEERIVLDASIASESGESDDEAGTDRMVVIDGSVERADRLAAMARDGVTVVTYDSGHDNLDALLDKIRAAGEGMDALSSIAFVGAGVETEQRFTVDSFLNAAEVAENPELAAFWSEVAGLLAEDGRIDLLTGDFLRGDEGRFLLDALEALTGVSFSVPAERLSRGAPAGATPVESDGVSLDDGYYDFDFLASLPYSGNDYFALPEGSELELREGEALFDWNQVFVADLKSFSSHINITIRLDSLNGTDIHDAFDWSGFIQIMNSLENIEYSFTGTECNVTIYISEQSINQNSIIAAFNQVTMGDPSAWNGGTLTVSLASSIEMDYISGYYTLIMVSDGEDSIEPEPPTSKPVEPGTPIPSSNDLAPLPIVPHVLSETSSDGDATEFTNRMADYDREFLAATSVLNEFLLEQFDLPENEFADISDIVVEASDVQVALGDLHRALSLLLHEFARSDPQVGGALQNAVGDLAESAQAQISAANRLVGMAADAAREWSDLPVEQRDGGIRERLASFAHTLMETHAKMGAAVAGLDAARERIAGAEAADISDPGGFLDRIAAIVDRTHARIQSELARRDSIFYELEALKIRRGRITSADGADKEQERAPRNDP